jgi:hypothetical protein
MTERSHSGPLCVATNPTNNPNKNRPRANQTITTILGTLCAAEDLTDSKGVAARISKVGKQVFAQIVQHIKRETMLGTGNREASYSPLLSCFRDSLKSGWPNRQGCICHLERDS